MNHTSLTQRFVIWSLAISLLPLLLVGTSLLRTFETELQRTVAQQLSAIADKKVDQIEVYLKGRVHDALVKTQANSTRQAMTEFTETFAMSGPESAAYRRLDASYRDHFKRFIVTAGYYDLFLISTGGTVVYSQVHEADFATNLFTGPYRDTGLAKVTRNALRTLESGISEFESYAPSDNAIASFIAVPIMIQGKVAGVLALQIDNARVFEVLLDETGLGMSGETVVARQEGEHSALVVAPLKSDPDAVLKRKIQLGDQLRAGLLAKAMSGERGSGYEVDYQGKPVVAAWRYLPRMKWGMVVKMDTAEALAPLYRARIFGLVALALAFIAAIISAILLGRRIIMPLKSLSHSAREIAAGQLGQRVSVAGGDELGQLARAFNTMAERLQSSHSDLERQVEQRTAELSRSLASLHIKEAAITSSINAIAIASLDGKISYVNQAFVDLWRLQGPEDAIGHSPLEFWEQPEEARAVMETLQQQGRWQGELRGRLHDGTLAIMQLSAHLVMDETGKPICMMGSFVDVTARKDAERELQKSRALLDSILTNMPAMVFVKRASDLRFERLNLAGEALLGFSEQELLEKNDYDFFPREQADFFCAKDQEVLASHQLKDIPQEPVLTRTGENRILHTRKIGIYDSAGEPTHLLGVSIDITEQIHAEEALQRERDFASSLVNTAPMIVLLLDTRGRIEYVNPYFEQLADYRLDEIKGKDWFSTFLPAREQDKIRALFQDAVQGIPTRGNINSLVTRGGKELEIEWYDQAMRDARGEIISVLATGQDVSARRAMEEALSASAERLNEAQRIAQVGSWELDLVKGELIWSDEIFRLFEIDKNQFGATYEAFLNAIHPDDRDAVNQAYIRSLETRAPYEITHRLRMGDGRIKWVHERCTSDFDAQGKPLRSIGTVQDITARKLVEQALEKSESLFRTLAQVAPVGIFRTDADGSCTYVNEQYCEIAGRGRETAMGEGWTAAIHPEDRARVFEEWAKSVKNQEPFMLEFRIQHPDGKVIWTDCQSRAETGSDGEVIGYVGTVADITVRKHNETALIDARQAAEAASRAKSEFLANMSHEIRTPMNAILGLTQLVLDSELPPRQHEFLNKAHASARALLGILNDILDYSKIEAGHMSVEQVPFRLEESLKHVADLFGARIEEKGLKLHFEIAPDVPANIIGDPLRLAQVLTNLVSNAIKFTERGEIHIQVGVAERTPTTQRLRFSVRDTGIGLSRAQSARLFQPFTQADGTTTRKYGGTGLGLSICQQLVKLMGGEIAASGAEGQGSTFSFTIQAGLASSSDQATLAFPASPAGTPPRVRQDLQGIRILLVEDNELNRLMAAELLERRGAALTLANNGAEAVERAKEEIPDAVLMDLHMPVMDGLEATRLIRELPQGKSLPIIAMTAAVLPEDKARCAAAGMVDFVAKPIEPEDMVMALLKWVKPGRPLPRISTGNAIEQPRGNLPASMPGFELEKALRRLEGNRELLARLLLDFAAEHSGTPARLAALLQAGNAVQAVDLLHTLKGVAANLGAVALAEAARQLEQEIKAGGALSATQGLTDVLEATLGAIRTHIAPARPVNGAPSLDHAKLTEVLSRLAPYLQEQELIPVELMDSLRDLAQADFPDKTLARLIRQVDHFDHDGALSSVMQLAALHEVKLE